MEIEFNGIFDKSKLFRAMVMLYRPSRRRTLFRAGIFIAYLIFLAYVFVAEIRNLSTSELVRVGRVVVATVLFFYFIFQPYISIYRSASRIWNEPATRKPIQGYVSTQGITHKFGERKFETAWEKFVKIHPTGEFIALMTADSTITLLQRSFFKNEGDWNIVLQWARNRVIQAQ